MADTPSAYPLAWPPGWPRTASRQKAAAIDALTSLVRWIDRGGRLPLAPQEPS